MLKPKQELKISNLFPRGPVGLEGKMNDERMISQTPMIHKMVLSGLLEICERESVKKRESLGEIYKFEIQWPKQFPYKIIIWNSFCYTNKTSTLIRLFWHGITNPQWPTSSPFKIIIILILIHQNIHLFVQPKLCNLWPDYNLIFRNCLDNPWNDFKQYLEIQLRLSFKQDLPLTFSLCLTIPIAVKVCLA